MGCGGLRGGSQRGLRLAPGDQSLPLSCGEFPSLTKIGLDRTLEGFEGENAVLVSEESAAEPPLELFAALSHDYEPDLHAPAALLPGLVIRWQYD